LICLLRRVRFWPTGASILPAQLDSCGGLIGCVPRIEPGNSGDIQRDRGIAGNCLGRIVPGEMKHAASSWRFWNSATRLIVGIASAGMHGAYVPPIFSRANRAQDATIRDYRSPLGRCFPDSQQRIWRRLHPVSDWVREAGMLSSSDSTAHSGLRGQHNREGMGGEPLCRMVPRIRLRIPSETHPNRIDAVRY
jgi:hypothetical protein